MAIGDKVPCRFCRNKYSPFNVVKHEDQCAMNPANGGSMPVKNPETLNQAIDFPEQTMNIKNIIVLPESGLVAHFNAEGIIVAPIRFVGTVSIGEQESVSLLVVDANGFLQPPSIMEGFEGIHKEIEPEAEQIKPEPEEPEVVKPERILTTQENTSADIMKQITEVKNDL
jgi:hypothetical protein